MSSTQTSDVGTLIEGIASGRVEVVELTDGPGEAVLCHPALLHPALLHATSMNCGPEPRFMRRTNFRRVRFRPSPLER